MKHKVLFLASMTIFGATALKAQLNVGATTAPVASAILQATSTTKGFLPPSMTSVQRDAISSPALGLLIYNTTTKQVEIFTDISGTAAWGTASTGFYTANGTLSSARTVTQGALPLTFNGTGGIVLNSGNVGIGNATPYSPLQFANNIANRKIVLFDGGTNALNDSNYYGFGINNGILRYQVPSGQSHQFFNNKTTMLTIGGSGDIYSVGPATGSLSGYYMTDRSRNNRQNSIYANNGSFNMWGNQNGNLLIVDSIGTFTLPKYGLGTFTGTAVNYLAVDANGKVIEQTLNSGTAPNIYNVNGAISSARVVDMNTYTLGFKGTAGTFTFNNTGNTFSTSASSLGLTQVNDAYGPSSLLLQNRYGLNGMLVTSGNSITGAPGFVAVTDVALQTQGGGTLNVKAKQVNLRAESRTGGIFGNYNNSIDTTELQLGKAGAPALVVGDNYVVSRTYFGIAMEANDSIRTLLSISPKATGAKITLFDGGNPTGHYGFGVSNGQLNYDADAHVFYSVGKNGSGTELVRFNSSGTTLGVKGAIGFNGSTLNGLLRSNVGGIFNIISGSVGINFDNNAGSANLMSLTNAGAFNVVGNISAGSYSTNSDRRLKTNIVSIKGALNKVMALVPYSYDKKSSIASNKYDHTEMGFIAQDIKKIFPELIVEGNDADKTLSVNYIAIIPLLTKAIQEQQAQNDTQVAQIAKLTKDNQTMAAQLADVKEIKTAMLEMRKELNTLAAVKLAATNTASK